MKHWIKDAASVAKTLLVCGLVGGVYGGLAGIGVVSILWWIAAVTHHLGKSPEIHDLLTLNLIGFAYGFPGGAIMGIIGGIIGGVGGWLFGGIIAGLAYGVVHSLFFLFRNVQREDILLPLAILPILGMIVGVAVNAKRSILPLCEWAARVTRDSVLYRWPIYGRILAGFALPVAAYVVLLAYVTWPTFWENRRHISRIGLVSTWQGSYRLVTTRPMDGRRATCQSNLKQVGLGMLQYMQDYDERLPPASIGTSNPYGWADALQPYVKSAHLLQCPNELLIPTNDPRKSGYTDYWYNTNLSGLDVAKVTSPTTTLMMGDGNDGTDVTNARYNLQSLPAAWLSDTTMPPYRHLGVANYAFIDGHVKAYMPGVPSTAPGAAVTFSWK